MSTKKSPNVAAVLETARAQVTVTTLSIPQPGPDELLVRNHAVAANPVEWKIQSYGLFIENYPIVLGSDVAGVVEAIGPNVTKFKIGDRVTGFAAMIYNQEISHGAWQTYTLLRTLATTRIPSNITFIEASVLPMAFATAACSLYIDLQLPRSPITPLQPPEKATEGFLVWGGASSVGSAVIQLAKNSGYKVFATASKKHERWLKSIGAYAVFDYHDSDVVEKVVEAAKQAGVKIKLGVDAVTEGNIFAASETKREKDSKFLGGEKIAEAVKGGGMEIEGGVNIEGNTAKLAGDVLAFSGREGKLVVTLPWPDKYEKPKGIEVFNGGAFRLSTEEAELGEWFFNEYLEGALENGSVVPAPPVEVVEGGIGATQKVWDFLKKGVSGKKLVVEVE